MSKGLSKKWLITRKGLKIFYLEGGKFQKTNVLVFLHGWGLSSRAFKNTIKALSKNYRVLAPDLPGFGLSQNASNLKGYYCFASHILDFLDVLSLDKVHLLGQSMGGGISLTIAAQHKDRIKSLVLANSAGIPLDSFAKIAFLRPWEVISQSLSNIDNPNSWNLTVSFLYNSVLRLKNTVKMAKVPIYGDLRPILSKVEQPCLLAWGPKDCMIPIERAHEFKRYLKDTSLEVYDDGYHEWCLMHPAPFSEMVRTFYIDRNLHS